MVCAPDRKANSERGYANLFSVLDEADAYVTRNGLDLPPEPEARHLGPDPACMTDPLLSLNLAEAGVTATVRRSPDAGIQAPPKAEPSHLRPVTS